MNFNQFAKFVRAKWEMMKKQEVFIIEADNAAKVDYKAKQAELAQLAKLSKTELEARIKALKS